MKNRNIGLIGICLFAFCSCDSWLSVSPSNEMPVEDQFGSEQGVKDALAGAYVLVKDQNLYGKALSFGYIENMASLWDAAVASVEESLTLHEYDKVTGAVDNLYGKMYNAIAKLLQISGITSKNGRNGTKWLNINTVRVSDDAKPKMLKKQRKAELSRRTVCKSLPAER